ncbi:MAG: GNAT family N-acetyltransferase [Actinomycetota bacterium]|nr:GNAT family N-acetyltransferase [Actinomycetota bacterium]
MGERDVGPLGASEREVISLSAEATHALRRQVLYGHWPEADVHYPEDDLDGAFHLGVRDANGRLVAISSWYPQAPAHDPARSAYRLRGMAVVPDVHGTGTGRLLFEAGKAEARRRGADVVWANARDSVLGFYLRLGMRVVGEGFLAAGGLPHHVVVAEL